ncbi:PAS domain-containing protein [Natrinema altunense]|uniref:PAS domain S-box protein n=1 Tax=Natrinema altunense TaxID=222984 RepID=A0A482XYE6_9EURY|nr:PAS domain-containing protein [Natrinema altunense]RZH68789.1 PAS domain S-box protein [Natrinema altunense]
MVAPTTVPAEPTVRTRPTRVTVLVIGGDEIRNRVERAFTDEGTETTVETAATPEEAVTELETDGIDCLVVSLPRTATSADASEEVDTAIETLDTHLETVRTATPDLPIVVLAPERTSALTETVRSYDWTAVIERDETNTRLADRVHDLLERRRLAALSRRSLASIEFAGDAIAIVDAGEIQFASRAFAMQFGYEHDAIAGTSWQDLFTDDAVCHLESTAIPTVAEGWRWTGSCTGRRKTGATFAARVRLGGLEDGSLVFVIEEADGNDGSED